MKQIVFFSGWLIVFVAGLVLYLFSYPLVGAIVNILQPNISEIQAYFGYSRFVELGGIAMMAISGGTILFALLNLGYIKIMEMLDDNFDIRKKSAETKQGIKETAVATKETATKLDKFGINESTPDIEQSLKLYTNTLKQLQEWIKSYLTGSLRATAQVSTLGDVLTLMQSYKSNKLDGFDFAFNLGKVQQELAYYDALLAGQLNDPQLWTTNYLNSLMIDMGKHQQHLIFVSLTYEAEADAIREIISANIKELREFKLKNNKSKARTIISQTLLYFENIERNLKEIKLLSAESRFGKLDRSPIRAIINNLTGEESAPVLLSGTTAYQPEFFRSSSVRSFAQVHRQDNPHDRQTMRAIRPIDGDLSQRVATMDEWLGENDVKGS